MGVLGQQFAESFTLDYVVIAGCGPNRDFTSWLQQREMGMIFSTALEMFQIGSQQKLLRTCARYRR